MNGALGRRTYGFRSTRATWKEAPSRRSARPRAAAPSSWRGAALCFPCGRDARPVELAGVALELPVGPEVAAGRDSLPLEGDEARIEAVGIECREQVPPLGGAEGDPLALALHDEARGDRLDAAGRKPAHDLLPEDRRDLVAVEPVEDAPRLLRVDEPLVDVARLSECLLDRVAGDLLEDHPPA